MNPRWILPCSLLVPSLPACVPCDGALCGLASLGVSLTPAPKLVLGS